MVVKLKTQVSLLVVLSFFLANCSVKNKVEFYYKKTTNFNKEEYILKKVRTYINDTTFVDNYTYFDVEPKYHYLDTFVYSDQKLNLIRTIDTIFLTRPVGNYIKPNTFVKVFDIPFQLSDTVFLDSAKTDIIYGYTSIIEQESNWHEKIFIHRYYGVVGHFVAQRNAGDIIEYKLEYLMCKNCSKDLKDKLLSYKSYKYFWK